MKYIDCHLLNRDSKNMINHFLRCLSVIHVDLLYQNCLGTTALVLGGNG